LPGRPCSSATSARLARCQIYGAYPAFRLAAKGPKITVSQSLELIAELFGVDGWNTLAAAIRREDPTPRNDASLDLFRQPTTQSFSHELSLTVHRTLGHANTRNHEYATPEHLLLAVIDNADASAMTKALQGRSWPP
jgi:hypothetical protein